MAHSCVRAGLALALAAAASNASVITTFTLSDHPDGNANPPPYGLRLDGLFNGMPGAAGAITTFSFSATGLMKLRVIDDTGTGGGLTIRIWGTAFGGEDSGSGSGFGAGLYDIDFTYNVNVAASGTGWTVGPQSLLNNGSITAQGNADVAAGTTFTFSDKVNDEGKSFLFLQDDHRLGGHPEAGQGYWVGRGWHMTAGGVAHGDSQDWLFIGELVPAPGAFALVGIAGLVGAARRRR